MTVEAIVWKPADVRQELQALDLDFDGLVDCVRYAEREWSFVTGNDALGFGNTVIYDKAGRALRERYLGKIWEKDTSNNQCAIKNPSKGIRVVPCNFDQYAGNKLFRPTNRTPKGEVSRTKAMCNKTGWLPGIPKIDPDAEANFKTWVLGIYIEIDQPTSAELSLPIAFDNQHFVDFGKRILFMQGEQSGGRGSHQKPDMGNDEVEVVDIEIRRK